ncbi:MAG: Uma2 family endonuclease [Bacteroidota bacterium]
MTWQDVLDHPSLQDLPFKIELNEWGQIVMTPTSNQRRMRQSRLVGLLREHAGHTTFAQCSVATARGVSVTDGAWASEAFMARHGDEDPFQRAPELCVEVRSPRTTDAEMREKTVAYLAKGAQEVWLCATDGRLTFHDHTGPRATSAMLPDFPTQID